MPYRSDGRTQELRASQRAMLASARDAAETRRREAESALEELEARFERERREVDAAIAEVEDARRRAIHRSMALGAREDPTLRDRLRTSGAVTALERAMATGARSSPPPTIAPLEELQASLRKLRRRRARLHARATEALERARDELAGSVRDHDEAAAALADAEAPGR